MPFPRIGFDPSYFRRPDLEPPRESGFSPDYMEGLSAEFRPATPAIDTYRDYINNVPQRGDYGQSIWAKIATALAGAGAAWKGGAAEGMSVVKGIQESPFQRAMHDFNAKGQYLRDAATMEERAMGEKLGYMKSLLAHQEARLKERGVNERFNRTASQKDEEIDLNEEKLKLEREKAAADQKWKAGRLSAEEHRNAISAYNAGIAAMNAETSRRRLGVEERGMELEAERNANRGKPNAIQQSQLVDKEFIILARGNPDLADVIDEDGSINYEEAAQDPAKAAAISQIRSMAEVIAKRKYGF